MSILLSEVNHEVSQFLNSEPWNAIVDRSADADPSVALEVDEPLLFGFTQEEEFETQIYQILEEWVKREKGARR